MKWAYKCRANPRARTPCRKALPTAPWLNGAMVGAWWQIYEIMLCVGMLAAPACDVIFGELPGNWRWMVYLILGVDHKNHRLVILK